MRSDKEQKVFYTGLWIFLLGALLFFISYLSLGRIVPPTPVWLMLLLVDVGFIVFIFVPQPGRRLTGPPGAAPERERWYPRNLGDIVDTCADEGEEGLREPVRAIAPVPLIPLALLLGLIILSAPWRPGVDEWREKENLRLGEIYRKASDRIGTLESIGRELGERVSHLVGTRHLDSLEPADRAALVHSVDSLANTLRPKLYPFREIGVQIVTPAGGRIAWGGKPRYVRDVPRGEYEARIFTSRARMYTLLVCNMPLPHGSRVVVDIPLEVNYRINNQFLRSTGLGEELSERFDKEIVFSFAMGEHRGEMRWVDGRIDTMTTQSEYDPGEGVMVHGVVRATTGLPLAYLRVIGSPYEAVLEKGEERRVLWGGLIVTLIAVSIALWVYRRYTKRGPRSAGALALFMRRLGILAAFLLLIRYLLLRLDLPSTLIGTSLFDPGFFADDVPFGLMRTTGDFLVTSLFALLLVFGAVKSFRTYYSGHIEKPLTADHSVNRLRVTVKTLLLFLLLIGALSLAANIVSRVVLNANPRLVGLDVLYLSLPVPALHLALLFMVSAIFILFLFLARLVLVWGGGVRREALIASLGALVLYVAAARPHWPLVIAACALISLSARIFPLLKKEEVVSIILSSFFLVLICSLVIYDVSSTRYTELRESRVLEKARDFNHPEDSWLEVVLPDLCQEIARDRGNVSKILSRNESAAFEIWAESSLSRFNLSCIFDAYDAKRDNFSHFEVGIPFTPPPFTEGISGLEGRSVVTSGTEETRIGMVYFYRGIAPIYGHRGQQVGAVVVTVPYFFENTELLARTGPLAPEILHNVERGALAPRVDEPEDLLVARVSDGRVVESSLPLLVAGTRLPGSADEWFSIKLGRERYNCVLRTKDDGTGHLVGYRTPGTVENIFIWATVVSLDVILTVLSLIALIMIRRLPVLRSVMPAISLHGGLGFREKILVSFLAVSIVPVILLGLFSGQFIQRSLKEEGEREAIEGVHEAVSLIDYTIRAEAESFAGSRYLREIIRGERDARIRDVPPFEETLFTLFDAEGNLLLDEGMSGFSGREMQLLLDEARTSRVSLLFDSPNLYGGVVIPVAVSAESGGYLYYRRRLDDAFLDGITDVVGMNINVYFDGLLRASSERELFVGGFLESILTPAVFADIALMGSRTVVKEAMLGDYSYQVASAPLKAIHHGQSGVLSVPMLYQPSLIKREILKSSSLMLGLLALLFGAAVTLGIFLAGKIFTPVAALIGGTRRIISGDLEFRLEAEAPDEIGELVGSFNTMTASLREARRDLLERQRHLAAVLDNVATGVMATDSEGRIITLNPSGERILGRKKDDVIGRHPDEVAGEGTAPFFALFSGGVREREIELGSGDARRTIKAVVTDLEEGDEGLGTVVVFDDLTELIRSKKLSAWIEMARQIAHEVKNPLTPIKLSAQLMRRAYRKKSRNFGEIFESGVETVIQQTEILRRISSEFSSFGRVTRMEKEHVSLDPFLSEFLSAYRGVEGVEMVYEPGDDIAVVADREALRKILVNVIENALDAMPGGGTLTVGYRRAGEAAEVVIEDTGAGLSSDVQERLFEPYFSTKTNGTGLGLAICRSLALEMGGGIRLRNRSGGTGVQAIVTVPIAP